MGDDRGQGQTSPVPGLLAPTASSQGFFLHFGAEGQPGPESPHLRGDRILGLSQELTLASEALSQDFPPAPPPPRGQEKAADRKGVLRLW